MLSLLLRVETSRHRHQSDDYAADGGSDAVSSSGSDVSLELLLFGFIGVCVVLALVSPTLFWRLLHALNRQAVEWFRYQSHIARIDTDRFKPETSPQHRNQITRYLALAHASCISYCESERAIEQYLKQHLEQLVLTATSDVASGGGQISRLLRFKKTGSDSDPTQWCALSVTGKSVSAETVIISFRGTASSIDALVDASLFPIDVKAFDDAKNGSSAASKKSSSSAADDAKSSVSGVGSGGSGSAIRVQLHGGVYSVVEMFLVQPVISLIESRLKSNPQLRVILCGHSLGGAYAKACYIALRHRSVQWLSQVSVTTFGAPLVVFERDSSNASSNSGSGSGGAAGIKYWSELSTAIGDSMHCVVSEHDAVPRALGATTSTALMLALTASVTSVHPTSGSSMAVATDLLPHFHPVGRYFVLRTEATATVAADAAASGSSEVPASGLVSWIAPIGDAKQQLQFLPSALQLKNALLHHSIDKSYIKQLQRVLRYN